LTNQRGNVSIIALAGVALAFVCCIGVARVGAAVVLQSRADTAADAAALAGADSLALGYSSRDATQAASAAASDNGARLVACSCSGDTAEVTVEIDREIGAAHGHARADVDLSREPALAP
jgi:secretion/DNA translocation related TadE-like protein